MHGKCNTMTQEHTRPQQTFKIYAHTIRPSIPTPRLCFMYLRTMLQFCDEGRSQQAFTYTACDGQASGDLETPTCAGRSTRSLYRKPLLNSEMTVPGSTVVDTVSNLRAVLQCGDANGRSGCKHGAVEIRVEFLVQRRHLGDALPLKHLQTQ